MYQISTINAVLKWERRLEIENERREALRLEPYRELPTDFEPYQKERKSILGRIPRLKNNRQPVYPGYNQDRCQETPTG